MILTSPEFTSIKTLMLSYKNRKKNLQLTFFIFIFIFIFIFSGNAYAQKKASLFDTKHTLKNDLIHSTPATVADILSSIVHVKKVRPIAIAPLFTSSAEFGLLYKTGNTNSSDIKVGLDIYFEDGRWLSLLNVDLLLKKTDQKNTDTGDLEFVTTDQKWSIASQTNYRLGKEEKNYVYGNIWFEESKFNSFANQRSVSSGWGHHWYKDEKSSLWGDVGPGYKRDTFRATETELEKTERSWIVQVQVLYLKKLGSNVEFKQYLSAKKAVKKNKNSLYKAESTITTTLISTLQLKFTYTLDYNTEVEEEKENMDTQAAVTLVYTF